MKLEKVIPAYRKGKKIRRKCWNENKLMNITLGVGKRLKEGQFRRAVIDTLLEADDWEIVKEKKKVKLRDMCGVQFEEWAKKNCAKLAEDYCDNCPFQKVKCYNDNKINDAWYLNKDLYSDKFLDQEIEVEE